MNSILSCKGVKVMTDFILIILPLILVSIAMVLLVNNLKKKNEKKKVLMNTFQLDL